MSERRRIARIPLKRALKAIPATFQTTGGAKGWGHMPIVLVVLILLLPFSSRGDGGYDWGWVGRSPGSARWTTDQPPLVHGVQSQMLSSAADGGLASWVGLPSICGESLWSEYLCAATSVGLGLSTRLIETPDRSGWKGTLAAEDSIRDRWVLGTRDGRRNARQVSDITLLATIAVAPLVDSLIAWDGRHLARVAQSLGLMEGFTGVVKRQTARERPLGTGCDEEGSTYDSDCDDPTRRRSFFSGHASMSWTAAWETCAYHNVAPKSLWQVWKPGNAWCLLNVGAAGATAVNRVRSDRHHLGDVVVGAVLGGVWGWCYGMKAERNETCFVKLGAGVSPLRSWSVSPIADLRRGSVGFALSRRF